MVRVLRVSVIGLTQAVKASDVVNIEVNNSFFIGFSIWLNLNKTTISGGGVEKPYRRERHGYL